MKLNESASLPLIAQSMDMKNKYIYSSQANLEI